MNLHINGTTANYQQVKARYPGEMFPSRPNESDMRNRGHFVEPTPRPTGDVVTQGQPEQRDGVWCQTWIARDYTDEERAEQLKRAKAGALQRINESYSEKLAHILADYPDAETKTWDKQESEARAYHADSSAPTPLIDAIAAARNLDKAELVQRVIAKADAWIALSGAATGKRQALEDAIADAKTLEVVEDISW